MKVIIIIVLSGLLLLKSSVIFSQDEIIKSTVPDSSYLFTTEENKLVNTPFTISFRKNTIGFINTINPEEFLLSNYATTVNAAMAGRTPGIITGTNLHGLGAATVFIDGIPGDLADINIEQVEQITILKDVNSAILYGVQAGRGIIMITTKRGKVGKPKTEVIVDQGISQAISLPKYLDAATYMTLYNEARANDGIFPLYSMDEINNTREGLHPYRFPDVDYYSSEFLKKSKPSSRYMVNFSGGNLNAQYFTNIGWTRNGSLLELDEKERFNGVNVRSNINFMINNKLKAFVDIAGRYNINQSSRGNYWGDASTLYPNQYTPLIDTSIVTNLNDLSNPIILQGGHLLGGTDVYKNNLFGNLLLSGFNRQITQLLTYRTGIDLNLNSLIEGLSFKILGSYTNNVNFTESQNNTYAIYQPSWTLTDSTYYATLTPFGTDLSTGTMGIGSASKRRRIGYYGTLDYNRVFNSVHGINATILAFSNFDRSSGSLYEHKYHHMGAKFTYTFDNKYVLDFSSVLTSGLYLSKENRLGYSPSLGLGWVISKEDFLANIQWLNYLKVKASSGILKTDYNISSYYLYNTLYSSGQNVSWDDGRRTNTTRRISNIGNSQLGYEKRNDFNLGAEAVLFNSLWLDINFYREVFKDILTQRSNTVPEFLGALNPWENYEKDSYSGFDAGLSYRRAIRKFHYELGGSFTYLQSKAVIRDEIWDNDYQYRAGKRTDGMWGLQAAGLFVVLINDISSHPSHLGTVKPGRYQICGSE
jgi:TonB-dependent SusC/RagA subfamily outer membrane receptor